MLIKYFDIVGFTPEFQESRDTKNKSLFRGFLFLVYVLFAIFYMVSHFIYYFWIKDIVNTSRNILKNSEIYNISSHEIYFEVVIHKLRI